MKKPHSEPGANEALAVADIYDGLETVNWNEDDIFNLIRESCAANNVKLGAVAQYIRLSITGKSRTPALQTIMWVMGRDRVRNRLRMIADIKGDVVDVLSVLYGGMSIDGYEAIAARNIVVKK